MITNMEVGSRKGGRIEGEKVKRNQKGAIKKMLGSRQARMLQNI